MKAITVHQPWAYFLGEYKRYETRNWQTEYRGELAIHASSKKVDAEGREVWQKAWDLIGTVPPCEVYELPRGAFVSVGYLGGVLQMSGGGSGHKIISIATQTDLEKLLGQWVHGHYAWVMDDTKHKRIDPYPYAGKQRLWNVPDNVANLLRERING